MGSLQVKFRDMGAALLLTLLLFLAGSEALSLPHVGHASEIGFSIAPRSPLFDLVPRSGKVEETGLEIYDPNRPKTRELERSDQMPRIPRHHMDANQISLFGVAIAASIVFTGFICLASVATCLGIGVGFVLAAWLGFFTYEGSVPGTTGQARKLLEPGDRHMFNVGAGHYEFDSFIYSFIQSNDTETMKAVQPHLDVMREWPHHKLELQKFENDDVAASAHIIWSEEDVHEDLLEPRGRVKKVKKVTYVWKDNKKPKYKKLGKRDQRKSDAKPLGKGMGKYMAKYKYKAYCMSLHDKASGDDVNKGTLYINNGKGVNKHCE